MTKARKPKKPPKPVVYVRRAGGKWRATCPRKDGCGRTFTATTSEMALLALSDHAYPAHGWTGHTVEY